MKVCFETFGCRLNKAEALQMEAEYLAKGWELTSKHSEANLIVVRGCSVTRRAQEDCEALISHLKRKYRTTPILICGCLKASTDQQNTILRTLQRRLNLPTQSNNQPIPSMSGARAVTRESQPIPTRTARAYLKVQDGCDCKCTFCIVPKFRGKSVSIDFSSICDQALRFIDSGYREIVLTGCNLTQFSSQGKRLPDLVSALADIAAPSECRLRLGSVEPGPCARDTVDAMAAHANVCRFLHLSIQSGANLILKAMGRPYQTDDVNRLITHALELMPNLGLGCDLITGFPGETNIDFAATEKLLRDHPFSNAHVFPYSSRPGTPAASFYGAIPHEVRTTRAHILSDLAKSKREAFARSFIGKTVDVVIEKTEKHLSGWTSEYLRCHFLGNYPRKSLVKVIITETKGDLLKGRPQR